MAYAKFVDKQLTRAFKLAQDLASQATFVITTEGDFDFSEAAPTTVSSKNVTVPVLRTKYIKKENVETATLLLKSSDIGAPNLYTDVLFDGKTWFIDHELTDNGSMVMLEISRAL